MLNSNKPLYLDIWRWYKLKVTTFRGSAKTEKLEKLDFWATSEMSEGIAPELWTTYRSFLQCYMLNILYIFSSLLNRSIGATKKTSATGPFSWYLFSEQ